MESELLELGIGFSHSRPYHPMTCGKVERFHQTMKKHLGAFKPARTVDALQSQLDAFVEYYNTIRPHRSLEPPRPPSRPAPRPGPRGRPSRCRRCRVRQDKAHSGSITLRCKGTLHHVAVGRWHDKKAVLILAANRDIRIMTQMGP
jgi:Integrase core domain